MVGLCAVSQNHLRSHISNRIIAFISPGVSEPVSDGAEMSINRVIDTINGTFISENSLYELSIDAYILTKL